MTSSRIEKTKPADITLIGDSTIDNKIWVFPGPYVNALLNKVGIHGASPQARIQRSHGFFSFGTELSVVENLMDMLPNLVIRDYTNDGFTTTSCLKGDYKDKVFPQGAFHEFPHVNFKPLEEGQASIQESKYVILSVGGNNFREFLRDSFEFSNLDKRAEFIKENFKQLISRTKEEYIQILKKITEINPNAKLILMTQYYPSIVQTSYRIYDFMTDVGKALDFNNCTDPLDVIHELVKQVYISILQSIKEFSNRVLVADLTSSLDPYDKANHVRQIEPSGVGGKKIAAMLKYLVTQQVETGKVYQFEPEFFKNKNVLTQNQHVHTVELESWTPQHPRHFLQNEKVSGCPRLRC